MVEEDTECTLELADTGQEEVENALDPAPLVDLSDQQHTDMEEVEEIPEQSILAEILWVVCKGTASVDT